MTAAAAGAVGTAAGASATGAAGGAVGVAAAAAGSGLGALSGVSGAAPPFRPRRCGNPAEVVPAGSAAPAAVAGIGAAAAAAGESVGASKTSPSATGVGAAATASDVRAVTSIGFACSEESKRTGKSTKAIVPRRLPSPVGSALVRRTVIPRSCDRRPTTNRPRYAEGASAKSTGFFRRPLASAMARSSIPMP